MSDERKYRDEEVEEIFDLASRQGGPKRFSPGDEAGLTLAELQEVGREVGLVPERIAEAAAALERRPAVLPTRKVLGAAASVGRIVELPRAPSDHEWELLVAELRETFGAKGSVTSLGGLREWSNGNLHALIEPTETGYRLRLSTFNGSAVALRSAGTFGLVFAAFIATTLVGSGNLDALVVPLLLAVAGIGAIVSPVFTLPPWARERAQQMEHIAARATALLGGSPRTDPAQE